MEILSFTLDSCPPAKMIETLLENMLPEINADLKTKAELIKVEASKQKEIVDKFLVTAVPTLLIMHKNQESGRILGFYPREELKTKIKTLLTV